MKNYIFYCTRIFLHSGYAITHLLFNDICIDRRLLFTLCPIRSSKSQISVEHQFRNVVTIPPSHMTRLEQNVQFVIRTAPMS